jgi:hypothetical protein
MSVDLRSRTQKFGSRMEHTSSEAGAAQPYPGRLRIQPAAGLSDDERQQERILAEFVQGVSADELYNAIELTYHGLVVNIDLYRELIPAYRLNLGGSATPAIRLRRTKFTAATFAPAKAASYDRFQREAAKARQVIILGGGPASGKTSALRSIIEGIDRSISTVYDTSLTDPASAEQEIGQALRNNRQVRIFWVFKPFVLAIDGMIRRAVAEGRYLTLQRMVDLHTGSRRTLLHILHRFAGVHSLNVSVLRDSADNFTRIPLADLPAIFQNPDEDIAYERALRQYQQCENSIGIPDDLKARLRR